MFAVTFGIFIIIRLLMPVLNQSTIMLMLFCVAYTVAMPLVFIGVAWKIGFVSNLKMVKRRERIFALAISAICAYIFSRILGSWHAPMIMRTFVLGATAMMAVAALLATFSRVSLHTIGWGGLTALVSYMSLSYPFLSRTLGLMVLISGLVATARLQLDEHTPCQVYSGFVIGFITIWITFIVSSLW